MRSRLIRLLLAAVLMAVAAGAAFVVHDTHRQLDAVAAAGRAAEYRVARLEFLATELRNTVESAHGAVPSAAALTRASGLMGRLRSEADRLASLSAPSQPLEGAPAVQEAGGAVATALERAMAYVDEGADLMAADVLANDASRGVAALASAVRQVRTQQARATADATAPLVERASILTAGAAALGALGLIVLAATSAKARDAASTSEQASPAPPSGLGLVAPVPTPPRDVAVPRDVTDLGHLADLCRDVAAAASPAELPSLLERTAGLLGAHGVILWAVSEGHLVPVAAHGYTASALRTMGRVPMSDGTPLADACHSFRASAVPASDGAPAALVVPLGTAGACHGILTAECRHADGFREDALAVARIAGSQFAAEFLWSGDAVASHDHSDPGADVPLDAASA